MTLLDLLDRPISFQRCFVDLTGSINCALMLSQAVYWTRRTSTDDGSFYKSRDEWQDETGMTHEQQEAARRKLRTFAFWKERNDRLNHRVWYCVDNVELKKALSAIPVSPNRKTRRAQTVKHGSPEPGNTVPSNRAEITSEITSPELLVVEEKKTRKGSGRATIEEVETFTLSIGQPKSDGTAMFYHFEEKGWGKNWQATVRKWKEFNYLPSQKQNPRGQPYTPPPSKRIASAKEIEDALMAQYS